MTIVQAPRLRTTDKASRRGGISPLVSPRFFHGSMLSFFDAKKAGGAEVMERSYFVYLLANANNRVLYTGITNNMKRRLFEHKHGLVEGFTKKYRVHKLVYFEETNDVNTAIAREKEIKGWIRAKKNALVEKENPSGSDLSKGWEVDSSLPEK
jgi:putative endonuclease